MQHAPLLARLCVFVVLGGGGIGESLMELFARTGASSTGVWLLKQAAERELHCSERQWFVCFLLASDAFILT